MRAIELIGRVAHTVLKPAILIAIRNSRRAYVVVEQDDKILVVKNILGSGKWHLPGGGCHASESFIAAAARELYEEVSIDVDPAQLAPTEGGPWRSDKQYHYELFSLPLSEKPRIKIDRREILLAEWVAPDDLNETNSSETTLTAVRYSKL